MRAALRGGFELEMQRADEHLRTGDDAAAFRCYERAHVLGQRYVVPHLRSHVGMLRVGWRRRDLREIIGQLLRIPGGVVGSAIGRIPVGNSGGANVSAFQPMEIPPDLRALLQEDAQDDGKTPA
nr:DUF3703 domain-containing protein [Enhygromyxa salina]